MATDRAKRVLLSFEMLFVLYLFSGIFKNDSRFAFIPVDLTALLGVTTVATACYIVYKNDFQLNISRDAIYLVGIFYALVAYAAVSILWSPSTTYAFSKFFEFAVLTGWPLTAAALLIAPSARRRNRLFYALILVAGWFILETIVTTMILDLPGNRTPFETDNYIGMSRAMGVGVLAATYYAITHSRRRARVAFSLYAFIGVVTMLQTGARGPFLAIAGGAAILAALTLVGTTDEGIRAHPAGQIALVYGGALVVGVLTNARTIWRVSLLDGLPTVIASSVTGGSSTGSTASSGSTASTGTADVSTSSAAAEAVGKSTASRLDFYSAAVEYWQAAPLHGHGLGSFGPLYRGGDIRFYPHNIFLEGLSELGLIGGLLLALLLLYPAVKLLRVPLRSMPALPHVVLVFSLVCYAGANAMVSGDLGNNRQLFTAIGLLAIPPLDMRTSCRE